MLSGIELLPGECGRGSRPVRIRAGWTSSWQDSGGQAWRADSYFLGGNALVRTTNPVHQKSQNSIAPDIALYASERWGHFSYAVPVAEGQYRVTLKFCEGHYGPRQRRHRRARQPRVRRLCDRCRASEEFRYFQGGRRRGRAHGPDLFRCRPTAQGKIVLTFVPSMAWPV